MYKLIALDCDGTLLNDKKEIDEETIEILKVVKNKGIKIVLATSRPFYKLKKYLRELDIVENEQYTIAFNGGYILNNKEDKILHEAILDKNVVKKIVDYGKKFNLYTYVYLSDCILANAYYEEYVRMNPDILMKISDLNNIESNVYKIIIHGSNVAEVKKARESLDESFNNFCEITSSNQYNIEFIPFGNSKPKALEILGNYLNIKSNEMIAFGDNENDFEMFKYVGFSVCMGNGIDKLKDISNYVTLSNNDHGVADALKKLIKEGII